MALTKSWSEMSSNERLVAWKNSSQAELVEHVRAEGQACDLPLAVWRFVEKYPIKRLIERPWRQSYKRISAANWRTWYRHERKDAIESRCDDPDGCGDRVAYLNDLERDYCANPLAAGPIVVMEYPDGSWDLGDGWHRVGIAITHGLHYIPAIVGREH